MEEKELSYIAGENVMVQPIWRTVGRFFKKLKLELPYDPVTLLLDIYLQKVKTLIHSPQCLLAAVYTIVKIWKQPKCPTTDD